MEKYDAPELTSFGTVADLTEGGGDRHARAVRQHVSDHRRSLIAWSATSSPELTHYGTVANLTEGGGTDTPEQSGSTFPITDSTAG